MKFNKNYFVSCIVIAIFLIAGYPYIKQMGEPMEFPSNNKL